MDLSNLKAQETNDLLILFPNGEPAGMTVTLQGTDAKEPRRVLKKWDKIASRNRNGLDFDQKEQAGVEFLAACIVDWNGYDNEGVPIECTEEAKVELLKESVTRFVRRQIDEEVGDVGSFLLISAVD